MIKHCLLWNRGNLEICNGSASLQSVEMHALPDFWRGDHVLWIFVTQTCVNRSEKSTILFMLIFGAPTCV